jgi:hypothetical protein
MKAIDADFYIGPKDYRRLDPLRQEQDRVMQVMQFGVFGFVSPLLLLLTQTTRADRPLSEPVPYLIPPCFVVVRPSQPNAGPCFVGSSTDTCFDPLFVGVLETSPRTRSTRNATASSGKLHRPHIHSYVAWRRAFALAMSALDPCDKPFMDQLAYQFRHIEETGGRQLIRTDG